MSAVLSASDVRLNDLFRIGIGPSSSHTVGPMLAAGVFADALVEHGLLERTAGLTVTLRGSLAATGRGHGTPDAVIAGLEGAEPATCEPADVRDGWAQATAAGTVVVGGRRLVLEEMRFVPGEPHPAHPNALTFTAHDAGGSVVLERTYLSVGGGFIEPADQPTDRDRPARRLPQVPFGFASFAELSDTCASAGLSVDGVAAANERAGGVDPRAAALEIWAAMRRCIERGQQPGPSLLPGGLLVRRRAPELATALCEASGFEAALARIQLDALAVNEQNALGHRVVTAPTNGAAGIIPAVIGHYVRSTPPGRCEEIERGVVTMLLTATAIGAIIKTNASISGAQVGCQGEVGSACAMAAGALCAAQGGSVAQVGKAAEMGLEHHLGLTCDPVGGLVQVPCIERNAIAAVTAVQAATLTLQEGDKPHLVSLDTAVETMRRVGADMLDKYKETSLGGLAVSVVEC